MVTFSGPTRPSTDIKKFRKTGVVVKKKPVFSGPTRPSTDIKKFRATGSVVKKKKSKSKSRSRSSRPPVVLKPKVLKIKPKEKVFSGPTRASTDVSKFRAKGIVIKKKVFSGPTRASTDIKRFRSKGVTKKFVIPIELRAQLKTDTLLNRFQTKQSLTPTQLKQVEKEIVQKSKALTASQIVLLKNAPKDIIVGLFEVGTDIVLLPQKVITGAVNYGISLRKRFDAGENNPLKNDINNLGKGTVKVSEFIVKNPRKAAAIVGLASSKVGKSLKTEFIRNPIKTTTKAVALLFTGTIIKGVSRGIKTVSASERVQSVLHSQRFISNKFRVSSDLTTGISKIKGTTKGIFLNGKKFTTQYSLKLNPKTKTINGNLKTKVGKKTTVEKISLQDKPGFYLDIKTNTKIPKITAGIKSRSITVKETTLRPIKGSERSFVQGGTVASTKDADFTTIITRIIDNTKKVTKRTGVIRLSKVTKGEVMKIKNFAKQLSKVTKVTKTKIAKPLTNTEIQRLEKFIDTVGIKNLAGLDRRIKIAKVLGIKKTSGLLKPLEQSIDSLGAKIKITKGKAVFKGEIISKTKPTIKFSIKTRKLSDLRKSKKGQISIVRNDQIVIPKTPRTKFRSDRIIQIPRLKSNVPLTLPRLRKLGLLNKTSSLLSKLSLLDKLQKNELKQKFSAIQTNKLINDVIQDVKRINDVIQEQKQDVKQVQIPKQISKAKIKPAKKIIREIVPKVPKIVPKAIKTGKRIKLPSIKLSFNTKLPKGERLSFGIKFREKKFTSKPFNKKTNPVVVKTRKLGLPLNKAIKKGFSATDRTTQRSAELFIQGRTKTKDIGKQQPLLNKFKVTKSKNSLKFLEKSKFSIDTRGEKRGLLLSKALKSKLKKKVVKKKVSKIKRKRKL